MNLSRIITNYKLNTMTQFSVNPEREKFMIPIRKNLVAYNCANKSVKPRYLINENTYKHLPISTIKREFINQSEYKNLNLLFLTLR